MAHDTNILSGGYQQAVIWQTGDDEGLPEQAIQIRTYRNGIIELRQGDSEILVNIGTVKELNKILKFFSEMPVLE